MKNKVIIVLFIFVALIGAVVGFLLTRNDSESIITLDINPSLELILVNNKIKNIRALNNDGNDVITDNIKGKKFNEAVDIIVDNTIEKGYIDEKDVVILLGVDGKASSKKLEDTIYKSFEKREQHVTVVVPEVTEEDKKNAEKYGITPAKAAYIDEIANSNKVLNFNDLIEKSVRELNEMKETGRYCDVGYALSGEFCEKVIREEKPTEDKVCSTGYEEIDGKCYMQVKAIEEPYCNDGLELKDGKCVGTVKNDASSKCSTGTYNSTTKKCEVLTYSGEANKACKDADDLLLSNGKCASHKPGAHSYGDNDDPFDEATECCCGDTFHTSPNPENPGLGWCYNMSGNYDATFTCPSGSSLTTGDRGKACYTANSSEPTFYCSTGKLEGSKCLVETSKSPEYKLSCSAGSELYQDRVCVDYSKTKEYVIGYVCDSDSRLKGNRCLYYEVIEAKES